MSYDKVGTKRPHTPSFSIQVISTFNQFNFYREILSVHSLKSTELKYTTTDENYRAKSFRKNCSALRVPKKGGGNSYRQSQLFFLLPLIWETFNSHEILYSKLYYSLQTIFLRSYVLKRKFLNLVFFLYISSKERQ